MDKDQEIKELKAALEEAVATIAQLNQRVQELEHRLNKDSHNSHLPPSSDRFVRQPKSLRKKSEKPSGGQKGHAGKHLMMVETPDHMVIHAPEMCSSCQHDLSRSPAQSVRRRQIIDLPALRLIVTEHQAQSKTCPHCQMVTSATFPKEISAPVQYGAAITSVAVYLSQVQLLPDKRVTQIMKDVLGVSCSSGSLHNWIKNCARVLQPVEEEIKTALTRVAVLHQDETGLYVCGKREWMHVASTPSLTHYALHPKRGRLAMDAIGIAPHFRGTSVHDGWASYQGYLCSHALCNVHHLRELTFAHEELGQSWAADLIDLLLQMKDAVAFARKEGQSALDPRLLHQFLAGYHAWLRQADLLNPPDPPPLFKKRGRVKQGFLRNLISRLKNHRQVLAFLHDFNVPFDNSQAERDIRMVKVQQKVSGSFRSQAGAQAFCRIRGYLSTMKKLGHHLLSVLEMALVGHPLSPSF